ncbi:MAG: HAD hydrolase-like protein [Xanthobacteraceae bacterium]
MVARRMRRRGWIKGGTKAPATRDVRKTLRPNFADRAVIGSSVTEAQAYVFDVEGTLIDTALPALSLWRDTLAEFGFVFTTADLHRCSGMSRQEMLARLLPAGEDCEVGEFVLNKFQMRYCGELLPTLRPLPGARALLAKLKQRGVRIALTADVDDEELAQYRSLLKADEFVDAFVCRNDAPVSASDYVTAALDRLGVAQPENAIYVGDTPCDAEIAREARVRSIGLMSGHFARADLLGAGCVAVFLDPQGLGDAIVNDAEELAPEAA